MPHSAAIVPQTNVAFSSPSPAMASTLQDATTVLDAVQQLGLLDSFTPPQVAQLEGLLGALPPAVDAAMLAAAHSAVVRGLPVTFAWKPGADVDLGLWETSVEDGGEWVGALTLFLTAPSPPALA